jgi:hypothetical protein
MSRICGSKARTRIRVGKEAEPHIRTKGARAKLALLAEDAKAANFADRRRRALHACECDLRSHSHRLSSICWPIRLSIEGIARASYSHLRGAKCCSSENRSLDSGMH